MASRKFESSLAERLHSSGLSSDLSSKTEQQFLKAMTHDFTQRFEIFRADHEHLKALLDRSEVLAVEFEGRARDKVVRVLAAEGEVVCDEPAEPHAEAEARSYQVLDLAVNLLTGVGLGKTSLEAAEKVNEAEMKSAGRDLLPGMPF